MLTLPTEDNDLAAEAEEKQLRAWSKWDEGGSRRSGLIGQAIEKFHTQAWEHSHAQRLDEALNLVRHINEDLRVSNFHRTGFRTPLAFGEDQCMYAATPSAT